MSVAAAPQKRHPWLDRFEHDPEGELQALLGGYARVEPYTRLEPSTLLTRLFDGLPDDDPLILLLDQTAQAFVAARRHDRPAEWQAYGLGRYVSELRELFMAVRDLALPGCIRAWGAEFSALSLWLEPLRIGDHGDARKAYWHLLAHHPDLSGVPLPVLKQHWTKLCALVGAGQLSDIYLDVALDGLSALPDALALTNSPLLTGFARWVEPLSAPEAESVVAPTWLALISAYPLSDADWAQRAATLFNDPTFRRCSGASDWAKVLGLDLAPTARQNAASALEPPEGWKSATDTLIQSFRHLGLTADWREQLDAFVARSEAFVNRTGNSRSHSLNMNFLGKTVLDTSPDTTLRLVHSALTFDTSDAHNHGLWAKALEQQGRDDAAQQVFWEGIRLAPDAVHLRSQLAALLIRTGQTHEAEALLRQTFQTFPDDEVAPTALAKLLAENGKSDAAEELYQQTRARFQNDPVCRLDLGLLLLKHPQRDPGQQTVSALLQELRAMNSTGANTLHFHLQRFQQGPAFALVRDGEQSPQPERQQSPNTANEHIPASPPLMIGAAACRAAFLLGPALVDPQLVLVSNDNRRDLQDEARETVRSLLKQAPDHPLLLLLARRYLEAGNTDGTAAFDADIFAMAPASPAMAIFARRWGHMPAGSGWVAHRWPAFTPLAEFATFLADPEAGTAAVARWLGSQPHHEHLAVARLRGELRRLTDIAHGPVDAAALRALHHAILQTRASTPAPNPLDALLDICLMATLETLPDQRLFELHAA
jgi:Flp pilus assembly protein TadD